MDFFSDLYIFLKVNSEKIVSKMIYSKAASVA